MILHRNCRPCVVKVDRLFLTLISGRLQGLAKLNIFIRVPRKYRFGWYCCELMSLVVRKPVFGVSDQVPHKPGCATTEDKVLKFQIKEVEELY